ncbi:MAG: GNAT family N-acetyltransferase [Alphaproteobacteria bacterium]
MQIEVIDTTDRLTACERDWNAVYDADPEAQVFLSWTWMANWLAIQTRQWLVLAARPAPDAPRVAFLPLQLWSEMRDQGGFYNTIRMGGTPFAGYTGILCDPRFETQAVPAFAEAVAGLNWAELYLDTIANAPRRVALFTDRFPVPEFERLHFHRSMAGEDTDYSVYPIVRVPADFEDYLMTRLKPKVRRNVRAALRGVEQGLLRITDADADSFERDLAILMRLWEARWAPVKPKPQLDAEADNHRVMLRACFAAGIAGLSLAWRGDTPVAADGWLVDAKNRSLVGLVSARDMRPGNPSPGLVLHLHCLRMAMERGLATYDLQLGNHGYKYMFDPDERVLDCQMIVTASRRNLRDRLEPRAVPVVFGHAETMHKAGQAALSASACRQILEVDPDHAGARDLLQRSGTAGDPARLAEIGRARALAREGKPAEAGRVLAAVLKTQPNSFDARDMLGLLALQQRRFKDAERELKLAARLAPEIAAVHTHWGIALSALGRHAPALKAFERAAAIDPDDPAAHRNRGNALKALGRFDEAMQAFARAGG